MDPYETPSEAAHPEASAPANSGRVFRWWVLPAAFSWLGGGLLLVAIPIGVYQNRQAFVPEAVADGAGLWITVAHIAMPLALLAGGTLTLVAGTRWLRGRWRTALALHVVTCGVLAIPQFLFSLALEAAAASMRSIP